MSGFILITFPEFFYNFSNKIQLSLLHEKKILQTQVECRTELMSAWKQNSIKNWCMVQINYILLRVKSSLQALKIIICFCLLFKNYSKICIQNFRSQFEARPVLVAKRRTGLND